MLMLGRDQQDDGRREGHLLIERLLAAHVVQGPLFAVGKNLRHTPSCLEHSGEEIHFSAALGEHAERQCTLWYAAYSNGSSVGQKHLVGISNFLEDFI